MSRSNDRFLYRSSLSSAAKRLRTVSSICTQRKYLCAAASLNGLKIVQQDVDFVHVVSRHLFCPLLDVCGATASCAGCAYNVGGGVVRAGPQGRLHGQPLEGAGRWRGHGSSPSGGRQPTNRVARGIVPSPSPH